jgi:coproporphyrinogen III oxidase
MSDSVSANMRDTALAPQHTRREQATACMAVLHDETTALFTALDRGGQFREDRWSREGGGGGVTRVLEQGATFEKVGANRSAVFGALSATAAERLGGRMGAVEGAQFFATGLSVVAHPRSPRVPTVHLNVRYFEISGPDGAVVDAWFGGGTDLTPTYPAWDDPRAFHVALRNHCLVHHASFYPRFKPWCDDYFRNTHRGNEARGCGGIFFDHLRPIDDESGLDADALFAFASDVARALSYAYAPIVDRRRDEPTNEAERSLQLTRRARYAEFNLLHDRGTLFGLQTAARIESVLMSLPPLAQWVYTPDDAVDPMGDALREMLAPRDWVNEPQRETAFSP